MKAITDFPGTPCLELISLQRLKPDLWRFLFHEPAGNTEAARLSEMLCGFHLHRGPFHCTPEFAPMTDAATERRFWLIDNEGMWLLSHLFTNWQEMYQKACPVVVEADARPVWLDESRTLIGVDPATGSEAVWLRVSMQDGTERVLEVHKWKMDVTPAWTMEVPSMEAQWKCELCGESYRTLIDPAFLVWLKDAPLEKKRVCAACHKQLTREQKIIREAK